MSSGTYTWNATIQNIISGACRKINILGDFETLAPGDPRYQAALAALNPIVKSYQALGMQVWTLTETAIPFSQLATTNGVMIGLGQTVGEAAPVKVFQALRRDNQTNIDIEMMIYTYDYYDAVTNKTATGAPISAFYQPFGMTGRLKVWLLPDTYWQTNGSCVIRYQRQLQDVGTVETDTLDFPNEWHRALIFSLAYDLAPEYGMDISQRSKLKMDRDELLGLALGNATEEGSMFIRPQQRWR